MNDLIAGIVTYNPDLSQLKLNIDTLEKQVSEIVIVDNASQNIKDIIDTSRNFENIKIITNINNLGIAKALNQLLEYAETKSKEWLLVLDQDSICPENTIQLYANYLNKDVGILCPNIKDKNDKYFEVIIDEPFTEVKLAITSGSLLNVNLSKKIGGFDEFMFIDFVDFEYCVRVIEAGYKIIRVNEVILMHQLGDMEIHYFLNREIRVTNHSSIRQYYYARNNIYMYLKHKKHVSLKSTVNRAFKQFYKVLFYEKNKNEKIFKIFKGNLDALKNRKNIMGWKKYR